MLKITINFEIKIEIVFVKLKLKANQIQETSMASASGYSGDAVAATATVASQDSSSLIVAFSLVTKLVKRKRTKNEIETNLSNSGDSCRAGIHGEAR